VGNGLVLILALGIIVDLPSAVAGTLELTRQGALSTNILIALIVLVALVTGLIVVMELALRRLPVEYQPRQVGMRLIEGRSDLMMKINGAGVIPAILASWIVLIPVTISNFMGGQEPTWWTSLANQFGHGRPLFLVLYAAAIVLCAFYYTAFLLDPEQVADDLKQQGGMIPRIEPGEATAAHVDNVLTRTTLLGAMYLAVVCLLPEILIFYWQVPFYFGGTSLLVVVCAALDLDAQLQGGAVLRLGGRSP
jgi:preprotein translocase subunit SecY